MTNYFSLGSEWRIWDLQVQTILDDQYTSLDKYASNLKALYPAQWQQFTDNVGGEEKAIKFDSKDYFNDNSIDKKERCKNYADTLFAFLEVFKPDLGCIGITDHNYYDSFLLDAILERSDRSNIKAIGGVEINVSGIHCLVYFKSALYSEELFSTSIIKFLNEIDIHSKFKNGKLTVCDKSPSEVISKIRKHQGIYIFPHCNSSNGLFQERGKTDRTHLSDEFNRKRRILLQAQTKKSVDTTLNYINSNTALFKSKPIFTLSPDSRRLLDIGKSDEEGNVCWIKSNPGFTGLQQIIYEPEARISISSFPPLKVQKSKVIRSIAINKSNEWLIKNFNIEFNESQVSIIGSKGSGKTALLDLIAFAASAYEYHDSSFLARATRNKSGKSLAGAEVIITWYDDTKTTVSIPSATQLQKDQLDPQNSKVLYLSQNFVEKLCSHDQLDELTKQIEAVIFQKIPKEDKVGYSNFQHYRNAKLAIIAKEKIRIRTNIDDSNRIITECRSYIDDEENVRQQEESRIAELVELMSEQEALSTSIPTKTEEEIRILGDQKIKVSQIEQEISTYQRNLQKCQEVIYAIESFNRDALSFTQQLQEDLRKAPLNITSMVIDSILVELQPSNLLSILNTSRSSIENSISDKQRELTTERTELLRIQGLLGEENIKRNSIISINEKIDQAKLKIASIKSLISLIELKKYEIEWEFGERSRSFIQYLNMLRLERLELKRIYAPIKSDLDSSSERNTSLLSFSVSSSYDIDSVAAEGESMIDHSKAGHFYRKDASFLKEEISKNAFDIIFEDELGNPLNETDFIELNAIEFENYAASIVKMFGSNLESQLRRGATYATFDKWLFNPDAFTVGYSVYFNKTPLHQLSPGMKGMALLILFLELDNDDNRPILIDQPEENLDNRSVYETLRRYFRGAKSRRQIIIATHNPNLVVNTDTEQVVVANFSRDRSEQESDLSYVTGALECEFLNISSTNILHKKSIRQHICHILEGGEDAFKQRELRYSLPK